MKYRETEILLQLLRSELAGRKTEWETKEDQSPASIDWKKTVSMADRHGILSLLYESLAQAPEGKVPEWVRRRAIAAGRKAAQQSYHLLFLSKYLIRRLEKARIPVTLLKGVGTASFYPVPELRKAGDVDLLLTAPEKFEECCHVLEDCGCKIKERQPALHHMVFLSGDGIEIELHTMLAEPFDNIRFNQYLQEKIPACRENTVQADVMGVTLPILAPAYHAYELLLHMLQHFLRSGFGLKLLCDWVVFWNRESDPKQREEYLALVRESGLKGFSDMVTLLCCEYLGLSRDRVEWMKPVGKYDVKGFLEEILEAEEFGKSASDRMVALRGSGLFDYIREFHHQMHLNFPKGGNCLLFWPALWVITLVRFLRNNRKIRKTSAAAILRKAGQRGRLMKQMRLWK